MRPKDSVQGQRRIRMLAHNIGRTRSQLYTLDYDEASSNQVRFLTMSCGNVVVSTELQACYLKHGICHTLSLPSNLQMIKLRFFAVTTQTQLSASTVPPRPERMSRAARSGRNS